MKVSNKFLLILVVIFSMSAVYAQHLRPDMRPDRPEMKGDQRNFHGKRFADFDDDDKDFAAVYIKSVPTPDGVVLQVFFTKPIDEESVKDDCFLINGESVTTKEIRFSKNRGGINIKLPFDMQIKMQDGFSLVIQDIKSINGKAMEKVEVEDCQLNYEYHFYKRDEQWKKS